MDGYTEAEWALAIEGPMMAGFAITAADPSSFVGALQESMATAKAMAEVHREGSETSLAGAVVAAYQDSETRGALRETIRSMAKGGGGAEATAAAVARLGEIAAVVRKNSLNEAEDYLAWLGNLANRVAEAGTEGGFLGFGGEKVSEAERRTLNDLKTALGGTLV